MIDLDVRIAKCLGWRWRPWEFGVAEGWVDNDEIYQDELLPGWSSSLDLMHELEGELSEEEWQRYDLAILQETMTTNLDWTRTKARLHISAEQKARAWLQVKEEKR